MIASTGFGAALARPGAVHKLAALALVASACTSDSAPAGDQVTSFVDTRILPIGMNTQLDLVFVLDSSPAMAPAQQKLAADIRAMSETLAGSSPDVVSDLHVGVITMDAAGQGQLRNSAFLTDGMKFAWQRETNFDGALADAVAPLAAVGAQSSPATRPFDTVLAALAPGANPGFVRESAYLAVVLVTAGDDATTIAPADAARALKALKTDPSKVLVTGAFGACSDGGITASAAPRLDAFVDQFPNRSAKAKLCDADLRPLTALVSQLYRATLGVACLDRVAEPHDCAARLVDPGTGDEILYRACASPDDSRCYRIEKDVACPTEGSLAVIPKPWRTPFPATAILECVSAAP